MVDDSAAETTADRGNINMVSTTKTPRRINTNPQSSSPPRNRDDGKDHDDEDDDDDLAQDDDQQPPSSLLATPLCTLSTLLQHSHSYKQSTLHLFRTCHAAHLHAIDRKKKAIEALRLAQAEYEHATTAEEFSMQELKLAKCNKDDASTKYNSVRLDVNRLATSYKGLRVELVNLQNNSNWNGRRGEIVKMITDGSDIARWKVKLDSDWRGKEPDGNYSPFEANGSGGNKMLSQDKHHVVARAENLQLIESYNHGGLPSVLGSALSRQEVVGGNNDGAAVKSTRSSSLSPALPGDDNDEESIKKKNHHPLDPVEELPESESHVVTPDRRGGRRRIYSDNHQQLPPQQHGAIDDWKRNALGSYNSPPGIGSDNNPYIRHHSKGIRRPIPQQWHQSPQQQQQQRIHHSQQRHQPQQQQKRQTPPARMAGSTVSPRSPNSTQQHMYDRNQVSSSFTEMATPMAFEAPSFHLIETTESFRQHDSGGPDGSFFEEVSQHEDADHRSRDQSSHGPPPDDNSTPTVVVLPLNNEEGEGNKDGRPTCFAVQNADISHVNGVYVLNEDESDNDTSDAPPLYFRDGDPILLSDGRYYDMCIMRSACPESPDHVIWFLARVNVDPDCLDVNFSDCYYYCRLLSSVGMHTPPMKGWDVSGMQPDAGVAFPTAAEASSENSGHRAEKEHRRQLQSQQQQQQQLLGDKGNQESSGLGALPRVAGQTTFECNKRILCDNTYLSLDST